MKLGGFAVHELDLHIPPGQDLGEQFTQLDFLAYYAAVRASAIGSAGCKATLRTLTQSKLEILCYYEGADSAVLKLCEDFVGVCDRGSGCLE